MKRFSILIALLCASTFAVAQKADAAFVVGGSFVSDTKETFLTPSLTLTDTVKTDHHLFLEGALGVRLLNAHVASLSVELPVAGITSQKITLASTPGHGSGQSFHIVHHAGIPAQAAAGLADIALGERRRRLGALLA